MKWISVKIAAICTIIFIIQSIVPGFTENFVLISKDVFTRPWILITSTFLHGSFTHLFYNMFALVLFGTILENIIGSRKFLILYFLSGFIASIGATIFYPASLGASGAIFGILGCLAILRPKMTVWVYGIPMPMIAAAGLWGLIDFIGFFSPGEIANAAHLFGLIFGIIFGTLSRLLRKNNHII